jgi:hypothetical protein
VQQGLLQLVAPGQAVAVTNPCQAFTFNDERETFMQAALGSRFAVGDKQTVVLEKGRIVAGTRKRELRVKCGLVTTTVKPESAAVIEAEPNKPARITVLNADGPEGVVVQVGESKFTIKQAGDELVVAEQGAPQQEIKPTDGIRRRFEPAPVTSGNVQIFMAHVPVEDAIHKNLILNCTSHFLENYLPVKSLTKRVGLAQSGPGQLGQSRPPQAPGNSAKICVAPSQRSAPPAPVAAAMSTATPPTWRPVVHRVWNPPLWMRAGSDSVLAQSQSGDFHLSRGSVLVYTRERLRMETRHGTVLAKPGSVLLVTARDRITRVLNLADDGGVSIEIIVGRRAIPLPSGMELNIVPRSVKDPEAMVWSDGLARRNLQVLPVDDKLQLVLNDVSIVDAFSKKPLLDRLRASGSPADKSLRKRIVKTAAVIALASDRFKGPYAVPMRRAEALSQAPAAQEDVRDRTY